MSRRFAIYFAPPPRSALEGFGRSWLGRDHTTGEILVSLKLDGLDPTLQAAVTQSARHYGFHATLKAPFELAPDRGIDDLYACAERFVAKRQPFEAPPLRIAAISKWVAFTLSGPSGAMDQLAADCVRDFEAFRAPMSEAEVERRRKSGLTDRQDRNLLAFGYPHIFEDFHFHMTLAGPLEPVQQRKILDQLLAIAPPLITEEPLVVDAISIYQQESRDQPFILTARLPFGAQQSS